MNVMVPLMLMVVVYILAISFLKRKTKYRYVGMFQKEGWTGKLPFYEFYCEKHGLVVNYPHGYSQILYCPRCWEEEKKVAEQAIQEVEPVTVPTLRSEGS